MWNIQTSSPAKKAAYLGVFSALCITLSWLDSVISAAFPFAGLRLGLANIVITAVILMMDVKSGVAVSLLRSGFVMLTRGVTAGIMSLCGGAAAFAVTALLIGKTRLSLKTISVSAALAHICGQLAAAAVIIGSGRVMYYAFLMLPLSAVTGYLTGVILGKLRNFSHKEEV